MATKKQPSKRGQLKFNFSFKDERIPKLLGMLFLFFALYLFIAFTSYLFTWSQDQDKVLRFSWGLLLQSDLEMANWLGRLGAIISNIFFYWIFGLPSYIFVFLFAVFGVSLIKQTPWQKNIILLRYALIIMASLSIFLEFIFGSAGFSGFSWGGAFGQGITDWLNKFVGTPGMIVLFFFIFIGIITWVFNPNYNELTFEKAVRETRSYFANLFSGRKPKPLAVQETAKPLKPGHQPPLPDGLKADLPLPPPIKDGQLAFELEDTVQRDKPKSLQVGQGSLEIDLPDEEDLDLDEEDDFDPELEIEIPEGGPDQPALTVEAENQHHLEPYDPTLELSSYEHPVISLLNGYEDMRVEVDRAELEANKDQIIETLLNYKIEIVKIRATIGPTVTLYEIVPAPGVRISKIKNLEDDIALSLAALGIRIIAPIPGRGTIGIEVPNKKKQMVSLKEVLMSDKFKNAKMDLPIALGKTISNEVFIADLAKMPHLLIAGATGQGKSVGINSVLISILYKKHPSQVKLVLIDPKKVELYPYSLLSNHFLAFLPNQEEPIITDTNKVVHTLNSLTIEMDARYNLLKKAHARNIREYNEKFVSRNLNPLKGHRFLPFIVLVIDEFADLIMTAGKEVEMPIARLAQLARAVGIHLIIATQRPSVNIITGIIKANFPARIAFKVTAKVDSRTILDTSGADQLIGGGDMLLSVGGNMVRIQGAFVDTPEVEKVIRFISDQPGYPEPHFLPEFHGDDEEVPGSSGLTYADLDEMFEQAAELVVTQQHGSTSMIQRRLKLGYNRAGRIMDQLEAIGIVGPSEGSKAREVLIYDLLELERYLEQIKTRK